MTSNETWMAGGGGGRLYDTVRERGIIAIGWSELIEAKPGMSRKGAAGNLRASPTELEAGHNHFGRFSGVALHKTKSRSTTWA